MILQNPSYDSNKMVDELSIRDYYHFITINESTFEQQDITRQVEYYCVLADIMYDNDPSEVIIESEIYSLYFVPTMLNCIIRDGNLDVLKTIKIASGGLEIASWKGHLHIVEWLINSRCIAPPDSLFVHSNITIPTSHVAMDVASTFGHYDILLYLHDKSPIVRSPKNEYPTGYPLSIMGLNGASQNGHLEIVKWHSFRIPPNSQSIYLACMNNHLDVARWLYDFYDNSLFSPRETLIDYVTKERNVGITNNGEIVKWLIDCLVTDR